MLHCEHPIPSPIIRPGLKEPLPLGLYIHIPWCIRKCPYCDFNSHEARNSLRERAYVDALLLDLDRELPRVEGREIRSIFIGGGTPSLFSDNAISRLLDQIHSHVPVNPQAEITLETNPGTLEKKSKLKGFRAAGVNRLSIGIQSFHPGHLHKLGRVHTVEEAIRTTHSAHESGFENINLDLMYGLPGQTPEDARADASMAVSLEPTHISCYQLTIEPHTHFFKFPPRLPGHDTLWELQEIHHTCLIGNGFQQYEISAFSIQDSQCQHNLNYWQYGDYLGIGAGAHGKITLNETGQIIRYHKVRNPDRFITTAGSDHSCIAEHRVSEPDRTLEFLMNALRLNQGFPVSLYTERTGLQEAGLEPGISKCIEKGLIERSGSIVRCTDKGRNFLDEILGCFAAD